MSGRRHIHSENGQAAVEFALVAPLLAVLLLAILQIGIAFNSYVTLTDATRAGARKAILIRIGGATPTDATDAVKSAAGGLSQSDLKVTVASTDWTTAGSDVTVTATYPYTISLLKWAGSWVGWSGTYTITSTQKERLE